MALRNISTVRSTHLEIQSNTALNSSDKTITVDSGERWRLLWAYVSFTTTGAGTRQIQLDLVDSHLIDAQTHSDYDNSPTTEGTFSGGTGYAASDVVTMDDGSTVTVNAVSSTVVTQFTITSSGGLKRVSAGDAIIQSSTDGSGTGFTLTPDTGNIGNTFLSIIPGATHGAGLTINYMFAPGVADLTSVRDTNFMTTPIPKDVILLPGQGIRVFDNNAVAPSVDDLVIRAYVDRLEGSEGTF